MLCGLVSREQFERDRTLKVNEDMSYFEVRKEENCLIWNSKINNHVKHV